MRTSISAIMTPIRVPLTTILLLVLYLFWWVCSLPFRLGPDGEKLQYLLFPASLLAVALVANQLRAMDQAMHVMAQRRLPPEFCRRLARDGFLQLAAGHALLVLSATLQLATPKAGLQLPTTAAVLSILAAAAWALHALARRLPRAAFAAGPVLGLLVISQLGRLTEVLHRVDALPFALLVALGVLWPALLSRLVAGAGTRFALREAAALLLPWPLRQPLRQLKHRVTFLGHESNVRIHKQGGFGGQRSWWLVWFGLWVFWQNRGTAFEQIFFPPVSVVVLAGAVAAFDLHWRHVLTPGGWRRASIGLRLWTSSFIVYGLLIGAGHLIIKMFKVLIGDAAWAWPDAFGMAVACTELGFMVALAVLMRGFIGRSLLLFTLPTGALFAGSAFLHYQPWFGALRQHAGYPVLLIVATLAIIAAANRVWNIQRLMTAARC